MTVGRNRGFDKEGALEKAMGVFWQNGYPGTSLTDLTNVMGINKSSLYAAFGNKEALFDQAIEFYLNKYGMVHTAELSQPKVSLKERIRQYLLSIAHMLTSSDTPKGCLICLSTSEIAGECLPKNAANNINQINQNTLSSLTEFFDAEQALGNVCDSITPSAIANYLLILQFGLAVAARNGNSLDDLKVSIHFSIDQLSL